MYSFATAVVPEIMKIKLKSSCFKNVVGCFMFFDMCVYVRICLEFLKFKQGVISTSALEFVYTSFAKNNLINFETVDSVTLYILVKCRDMHILPFHCF